MHNDHGPDTTQSPRAATPRRSVLAGLTGLVVGALAGGIDTVEAKRKGKNKRKKRNRKNDAPQIQADAQCAGTNGSIQFAPTVDGRVAQTFTALRSGALVRAEVLVEELPGALGEYILQLAPTDSFGFPTNEVLAAASVPSANVPDGRPTISFTFPQPASVQAGLQYALVLSRPEVGVAWLARNDDGCAGRGFTSTDRTGPFQGSSLTFDLIFATFVLG